MLEVSALSCGYGKIIAVRELSFVVKPGEMLALIGANGAGKSSALMCICGLVTQYAGQIIIDGKEMSTVAPERRIHQGVALVPEGRRVFADLSVLENLMIGGQIIAGRMLPRMLDQVYTYFPRLRDRQLQLAGSLSGGEQQMLAIGRALMCQPRVLLVDEISLGLMPKVIDECYTVLTDLKNQGVAIVLVEQDTERGIDAADHVVVLEAGNPVWQDSAKLLRQQPEVLNTLLGIKID